MNAPDDVAALRLAVERNSLQLVDALAENLRSGVPAGLRGSDTEIALTPTWLAGQGALIERAVEAALADLARLAAFGRAS